MIVEPPFSGKSYIPGIECVGSTSPHSARRNPYSNGAHQLLLSELLADYEAEQAQLLTLIETDQHDLDSYEANTENTLTEVYGYTEVPSCGSEQSAG